MKEYLEAILTPLLTEPSELTVSEAQDAMGILLSVQVAKPDMGVCIGKKGEMAKSIRHLMRVYGGQKKARVSVRFIEPLASSYVGSETLTTSA